MTKRQLKDAMRILSAQLMELPLESPKHNTILKQWNELAAQLYK